MKNLFYLLISAILLFMTSSCGTTPIEDRIWVGKLNRISDCSELSDVCLKIRNDSLIIYSNAIFGSDNERLVCLNKKKSSYTFGSDTGRQFDMTFLYSKDDETGDEILSVAGVDYTMYLNPVDGDDFSQEMLDFYLPVPAPPTAALCFSGRWSGEIVRTRDNQILSPVCVEYDESSVRVYANAIFGKLNEILIYAGFFDDEFHYMNAAGEQFAMRPILQDGQMVMEGDDFRMILSRHSGDWDDACSFYKGREVPRSANGYMFGSYSGKSVIRFPQADVMGMLFGLEQGFSDFQITVSLVFIEDNRCRMTTEVKALGSEVQMMMALFGGSAGSKDVEVKTYKVVGNKLIVGENDEFIILSDGSLYASGDEMAQKTKGKCVAEDLILKRL